jgi:hypothetical protein
MDLEYESPFHKILKRKIVFLMLFFIFYSIFLILTLHVIIMSRIGALLESANIDFSFRCFSDAVVAWKYLGYKLF